MGKEIRFGVIGAAYMGKAYAIALSSVSTVFELPARAKLEMIATTDEKGAEKKAAAFGFARSTGDWRKLVTDPDVDIVGIGSPTYLHKEMALAAIAAGKPVLCEKPLSLSAKDANDMALAAERAGVKTARRLQLHEEPGDAARQTDDRTRRDRRHHPFPRDPQRRLSNGPGVADGLAVEGKICEPRRRARRSRLAYRQSCALPMRPDRRGRRREPDGAQGASCRGRRVGSGRKRRPDQFPRQVRQWRARLVRGEPHRRRAQDGAHLTR